MKVLQRWIKVKIEVTKKNKRKKVKHAYAMTMVVMMSLHFEVKWINLNLNYRNQIEFKSSRFTKEAIRIPMDLLNKIKRMKHTSRCQAFISVE